MKVDFKLMKQMEGKEIEDIVAEVEQLIEECEDASYKEVLKGTLNMLIDISSAVIGRPH